MTDNIAQFPGPPIDLVDVYCAYLDSDPDIDLEDPRLLAVMDAMGRNDAERAQAQLLAENETKLRRAKALYLWRRRRVLQRDPSVIREIAPTAKPPSLRILQGFIELDGVRIARLLPGLRLGALDRLTEAFDAIEDAEEQLAAAGDEK
jgi:hypothetical protein